MFEILPQSEGENIAIRASGIISESDYEAVLPEFENRVQKVLQFRLLLNWEFLEGWEVQTDAVTFGVRFIHRLRCERIAIVSNDSRRSRDIEHLRSILLRSSELRVFPPNEHDAAWSWLTSD